MVETTITRIPRGFAYKDCKLAFIVFVYVMMTIKIITLTENLIGLEVHKYIISPDLKANNIIFIKS